LAAVLAVVAVVIGFLRTPALEDGTFQNFPGSVVGEGVVTYDLTTVGDVAYVLSAKNTSRFPITLVAAATDGSTFTKSSVDLGEGQPINQAGVLNPGDEVRFAVHGSNPGWSEPTEPTDCVPFTSPVPSVVITYTQLGVDRTATITAGGRAVLRECNGHVHAT
jgi:hypothetical protein